MIEAVHTMLLLLHCTTNHRLTAPASEHSCFYFLLLCNKICVEVVRGRGELVSQSV